MSSPRSEWIWFEGAWTAWDQARVHVTAHSLHYGSNAFEGIRAYETAAGPAIFRLGAHVRRLFQTCKLLRMDMSPWSEQRIAELCVEIVARNRHSSCYIRPLVYRDSGAMGLNPLGCPVELTIFSFEWGRYLGPEAIEAGVDAAVSSWRRFAPGTMSALGKIGGQYVGNQFSSVEARLNGFAEGIMLDADGYVAEGAGENLFIVIDGELNTPPLSSSILAGITRDTVLTLARDRGLAVRETHLTRDMLYLADELFMTGTAAEVTPVRSVDRIPIGDGRRGPITEQLQADFFGIVNGTLPDRHGWLTRVPPPAGSAP
ncbi:MAG: branched-chain amino acid transaminase [Thermoanaerobaculia bacterium]|nr:branched-chain amino acid transaminase [Thermoanaerobaculia bacterium]